MKNYACEDYIVLHAIKSIVLWFLSVSIMRKNGDNG